MIKNNKLAKKTKRVFNSLSHYQFQMKMKYQCEKWQRKLMIVNESYTSKTCTRCGEQNNKLKGSKVFKCNKCNLLIDRDINGARNIFIKNRGQDKDLKTVETEIDGNSQKINL
jgi:putative transposase